MRKIVHVPNSVLTTPSKPVEKINSEIVNLVKDMEETLAAQVDPQGVGLAAPQVGVGLALFITKPNPNSPFEAFINPEILEVVPVRKENKKGRKSHRLEGCLSIPFIWSPVKRGPRVRLEYTDLRGVKHKKWFKGFMAVIVQHEVDHLHGVLFTQRALEQKLQLYEEKEGKLQKLEY